MTSTQFLDYPIVPHMYCLSTSLLFTCPPPFMLWTSNMGMRSWAKPAGRPENEFEDGCFACTVLLLGKWPEWMNGSRLLLQEICLRRTILLISKWYQPSPFSHGGIVMGLIRRFAQVALMTYRNVAPVPCDWGAQLGTKRLLAKSPRTPVSMRNQATA